MQWLNNVSTSLSSFSIGSLFQNIASFWQEPEDAFFMQAMEDENYQAYLQWCSDVRRTERSVRMQLERKQLSPAMLQNALLQPVANLSSLVSPLYYYLRLMKLELAFKEKNYPKAFCESIQEVGYRLKEQLKENPELTRNYFYQDILNHLIEHSAQRFSASKLLGWMKFYEGLVEEPLYQSVKQALEDFIKTLPTDGIAARHYKKFIVQLNRLFQTVPEAENSIEAFSVEKNSNVNYRFLTLAGLALTGSYAAYQVSHSYNNGQNGLIQSNWQSLGIIAPGFCVLSALSYSQSYWLSLPILAGSLTTLFPLTAGQIILNGNTLDMSSLNGTYGFVMNGANYNDQSGISIATGDINGDGTMDVLIGAYQASPGGRSQAGASYVVFGHTGSFSAPFELSTLDGNNGFVMNGVNASDWSGYAIASGDINADGKADILIGAYHAQPYGKCYVVFGHTTPFPAAIELSSLNGVNGFVINGTSFYSGYSIASGDINADGAMDVLIGAIYASPGGRTQAGASYVVFGHTGSFPTVFELSTLDGTNGFVMNGVNMSDWSGSSIASGDINADGIADVLIGASFASPGGSSYAGASYVVFGHTEPFSVEFELSTLNGTNGFSLHGINARDALGYSIASGDINADGKADVLIGANSVSNNVYASYVVFGYPGSFPATFDLSTLNGTNGFVISGAGATISSGDINADGVADVLIGAYNASPNGKMYAGASYVVFGHTGLFPATFGLPYSINGTNGFIMNGVNTNDCFGRAIASGDINQDGRADVLIGANSASPGTSVAGASYTVFGSNAIAFVSPSSTPSVTPSPSSTPSITPSPSSTPSNTPSSNSTPSNTPSSSSTPSNNPTPSSSSASSNRSSSNISSETKIAVGVSLGVLGLFAVSGAVGYKLYQRRKASRDDLELRGSYLSNKKRRAIEHFILVNDLDAKEAEALYIQTGIRVPMPEVGQYQKVVLGEGEFGKVKLAYDQNTYKYIGVKKIKGVRGMKASEQERLVHERLNGLPHILPLLYSEITEDSQQKPAFYQFIPLAGFGNGERLRQQLEKITDEKLKAKLIQHVGQGLLTGIAGMHENNTYHLDIKPQNYMLTIDGIVYVIDFGCTREFKSGESCWIENGGTGDASCFSPERLANFRYVFSNKGQVIGPASEVVERYDAEKADAWSVGLALLELMLGYYPLNDDNVGFTSRLNHWDSASMDQLLKTALAAVESTRLLDNQPGQTLFEIIKGLLAIDSTQRLTVREALKHSLFAETVFKPTELKEQFRALKELGMTGKTENSNEITRRDGSLYSATITSRADDPNYGSVLSIALKA